MKREGRRARRVCGHWVREGVWDWAHRKKKRRVVGWEARVLEEMMERRRGWVRCGMWGFRVSGFRVFVEVKRLVRVLRSWGWVKV